MFTIRPFDGSEADYEAFVAIDTAFYPYPLGLETLRFFDESRPPELYFRRDLIECDGVVVAFGETSQSRWAFHPQKYNIYLLVHPDHEHPDIRPLYFRHAMDRLAEFDPLALTAGMLEGKEIDLRFLHDRGFREVMRTQLSELDVTAFDPAPFAAAAARVETAGIRIRTLSDLMATDPDWKVKLHSLECAIIEDIPSPDPQVAQSMEVFEKTNLDNPNMLPDSWFVAVDGAAYVGTSRAWRNPARETQLDGSLTGVIRSYRRRGIATALKLRLIAFAQAYGAKTIVTANEENNPMYTLNQALGFRPQPAWINFEKPLRAAEPGSGS